MEPRDDEEVEAQREKLLRRVNGFSEFDDHLKSFFNGDIPNGAEKMGREFCACLMLIFRSYADRGGRSWFLLLDLCAFLSKYIFRGRRIIIPCGRYYRSFPLFFRSLE